MRDFDKWLNEIGENGVVGEGEIEEFFKKCMEQLGKKSERIKKMWKLHELGQSDFQSKKEIVGMRRKLRDNIWDHGFSYLKGKVCNNRYVSIRTIKDSTHPNIEYQKKQFFVDSEIDKDEKYFKSMS